MASVHVLDITAASDGIGTQPDGAAFVRNDTYFLEKIAERWMKEEGQHRAGITYRLAHLPAGFKGYEKARDGTKHIDRYLYGHPNGIFRSLNEIWPHFKHLQEHHGTIGCPCKLCTGVGKGSKKKASNSNSIGSGSPSERSTHFVNAPTTAKPHTVAKPKTLVQSAIRNDNPQGLPQGRLTSDSPVRARAPVDEEDTPDIYRNLLNQLQQAGPGGISENIVDSLSPDWRAGNEELQHLLSQWQSQPSYIPRIGEIVLFARNVSGSDAIAWDASSQSLRRVDEESRSWLERLQWQAGVVTQLPLDVAGEDHAGDSGQKNRNIAYTGYRIEPVSQPSIQSKPFSRQYKYVAIAAIRPFSFWRECVGTTEEEWHPTLKHALTTASSFSLIGKYCFKGVWPEATLFVRGVYLGPELIMVDDVIRLAPTDSKRPVTDIMVVSSIRLRFVNLDEASSNDYDDGRPYLTCLHVCGRAFTLDPKKSSEGIAKAPVRSGEDHRLPAWLKTYGQWFHATDTDPKAKMEIPYHKVIGRCFEDLAVKSWFPTPKGMAAAPSFQPVNPSTAINKIRIHDLSQGLEGIQDARKYSREQDGRIDKAAGKSWFWAESRIEQLDLHEVNGEFVGVKDEGRSKKQLNAWRQALKVLDGKKGGLEEYHAARQQRVQEEKSRESAQVGSTSWGLMGSATKGDSRESEENDEDMEEGSGMETDALNAMDIEDKQQIRQGPPAGAEVVDLSNDLDDDDEMYD